jgi:mRNA-degrading endonuclease RelE of RelBE toxin-antitoxin system
MIVSLSKRFQKEFDKIPKTIQTKVWDILDDLEKVDSLIDFPDCKPIEGYKQKYYRIRVRTYRLGFEVVNNQIKAIHIITIKPRGDIYKTFPPK